MKYIKLIALFALMFFIQYTVKADTTSSKPYRVKVKFNDNRPALKGILYQTTDSSIIVLSDTAYYFYSKGSKFDQRAISYKEITKIKIWRKNKFIKCIGLGAATGLVIGTAVAVIPEEGESTGSGYAGIDEKTQDQMAIVGGTVYGAIGGAIIGSFKKKVTIDSNLRMFKLQKPVLQNRSLVN